MADQFIRVLVVDDHYVTRKGILGLLNDFEGIEAVGEAENGREAVDQARALEPDVILMDLVMPQMGGVDAIRKILEHRRETAILVLSGSNLEGEVLTAVRAGALGYLSKTVGSEEMAEAIRRVHRGEPTLPPELNRKLLGHDVPTTGVVLTEMLTGRELEVLTLVARGSENKDISERLGISEATVRTHLRNMLSKLGVSNRVELVLYALEQGWASLEH